MVVAELFRRLRAIYSDFGSEVPFDEIRRGHLLTSDFGFDQQRLREISESVANEFRDLAEFTPSDFSQCNTVGDVFDRLTAHENQAGTALGAKSVRNFAQDKPIRILGVHGLGGHEDQAWKAEWKRSLSLGFAGSAEVEVEFVEYDPIFADVDLGPVQVAKALRKLGFSAGSVIFDGIFKKRRGKDPAGSLAKTLRYTAGYVIAWVENEEFKAQTQKLIYDRLKEFKPDVLVAHSLGSMLTYDALREPSSNAWKSSTLREVVNNLIYVTCGSQISNPFVQGNLAGGKLAPVDNVRYWFNLFNRHDSVFTNSIRIPEATNFEEVATPFDIEGLPDHAAGNYFRNKAAMQFVWKPIAAQLGEATPTRSLIAPLLPERPHRKRAVLIGINDYPNPEERLEGCVNDVYLMSSLLQECGFAPEQIRICLNHRATAKGIRERLEWLVDDAQPQDQIVFYFSGHGARLATYGAGDLVDKMDETLVPYDFDWRPDTCITDDQIYDLYSQLPYDTRLAMIFDCCHSGGIHRAGSPKSRGVNPPDDIRHRAMKWDSVREMWVERGFEEINPQFSDNKEMKEAFCGANGATFRLGRAMQLRPLSEEQYERRSKNEDGPLGPYLPLILEACREEEFAYEYRDGATSYGAFTFSLAKILRQKKDLTFQELVKQAAVRLAELQYDQRPQILGPEAIVNSSVPWAPSTVRRSARPRKTRR